MGQPLPLRQDYDASRLRRLARHSADSSRTRRLLALAVISDGGSRSEAAQVDGVGRQIVRDWVLRFNAEGPDGLLQRSRSGRPARLNEARLAALIARVETGPLPAIDGVVRWRLPDLAQWLWEDYRLGISESCLSATLRKHGYRKLTARPRHYGQNVHEIDAFKKNFPAVIARIRERTGRNVPLDIWWQDEARVGQKNKITQRWAKQGTRPVAPKDQRTKSAWIFGAICPARGVGAALVLPRCDTRGMQGHLEEISSQVEPGAHAVIILDKAGWHTTGKLDIPDNITLLPLPPRSPAPVENVWQYLRQNRLSNRIFDNQDQIVSLCCDAWNNLTDRPSKIRSIGYRKWAHGF